MSKTQNWQSRSWAKRRLWELVIAKFTDPVGRRSIELTREELVRDGVFGDFDEAGKPLAPNLNRRKYTND